MTDTVVTEREREKYARMWEVEDYHAFSPGEQWLPVFLELVGEQRGRVLDAGCGTGRAGIALAAQGFDVTLCDVTPDALETESLPFAEQCLWKPIAGSYDFGYCCDVMEHLPQEMTMLVVVRLLSACERVFLSIATEPDQFGVRIGEPLHLTVQSFTWWRDRLREIATLEDARDCGNTALFYLRRRS